METDREKYLRLIQQSKLFNMEPTSEPDAYHREALRIIEYLYRYLVAVDALKYADMGLEITETARRCIYSFKSERGEFLPYFLAAWKQEYKRAIGRKCIDQRYGGIGFTEEEQRNIRNYARLAAFHRAKEESEDFIQRAARIMKKKPEEVKKFRLMTQVSVGSDIMDGAGAEYSVFDYVDSGERVEEKLVALEAAIVQLHRIEDCFNSLQNRQKPLIACLITAKIAGELSEDPKLLACAATLNFFDSEIYSKVVASKAGLSAREIAHIFGLHEASVSRSWKTFREKLELL